MLPPSPVHVPEPLRQEIRRRLDRVERGLQAVERMILDDVPDASILRQIAFARNGVNRVGRLVLHNYLTHCIPAALAQGEVGVLGELMEVLRIFIS